MTGDGDVDDDDVDTVTVFLDYLPLTVGDATK